MITIPGGAEIPHVVHLQTYHQFNAQENRGEGANVVRDLESGERDTGNGRRILDKIKAGARIQIPGTVYVRTEKVISEPNTSLLSKSPTCACTLPDIDIVVQAKACRETMGTRTVSRQRINIHLILYFKLQLVNTRNQTTSRQYHLSTCAAFVPFVFPSFCFHLN